MGTRGRTWAAATAGVPLLPQITIRRSGGFAGLSDTVTLDPDGAWTVSNRAGTQATGQLSADQIPPIQALATDPRLADEALRPPVPTRCRDAFHYVLTVGAVQIGYADCPTDPGQPTAAIALVDRILQVTKRE